MERLKVQDQLMDLRELSPIVDDYLARELFKDTFGADSDYTVNDILNECYHIILEDFKEYGVSFTTGDELLLGDWFMAKHVYWLRHFLDSQNLYKRLLGQNDDLDKLETMLNEEDEDGTDLLNRVIMYLASAHPLDLTLQYCEYISSQTTCTETFRQHISAILANCRKDPGELIPDIDQAKAYIAKIDTLRKMASEAVNKILEALPDIHVKCDMSKIKKLLKEYDMDKLAPDQIKIYAAVDVDDVNPALITYKNAMMEIHHRRAKHHLEYWLDPTKDPLPTPAMENCVLLVAHMFEPGQTSASFQDELQEMLTKGASVFTLEQIDAMTRMGQVLYENVTISNVIPEDTEEGGVMSFEHYRGLF